MKQRYILLQQDGSTRTTVYSDGQTITTMNHQQQRVDVSVICQGQHEYTCVSKEQFRLMINGAKTLVDFFNLVLADHWAGVKTAAEIKSMLLGNAATTVVKNTVIKAIEEFK